MVDRFVRIGWMLLAASCVVAGSDAKSSGARNAGGNGVAHRVLPVLSLVVLSRVACVHGSAHRLLSDGGEARDMIEKSLSPSIAHYRHQAKCFDGRPDGKICMGRAASQKFQGVGRAGDY